jgi:hypothetical protein
VTIVVLVLVSLVSWWNWPRGDARFVGKWQFVGVILPDAKFRNWNEPLEVPIGEVVLRANGSMDDCKSFTALNYDQWSIREGALVFHKSFHALPDWAVDVIRDPYFRWTVEIRSISDLTRFSTSTKSCRMSSAFTPETVFANIFNFAASPNDLALHHRTGPGDESSWRSVLRGRVTVS